MTYAQNVPCVEVKLHNKDKFFTKKFKFLKSDHVSYFFVLDLILKQTVKNKTSYTFFDFLIICHC